MTGPGYDYRSGGGEVHRPPSGEYRKMEPDRAEIKRFLRMPGRTSRQASADALIGIRNTWPG